MRVIAGEYKGRRLTAPGDYSVRPTSDKVKEAMFSILTGRIWGSRVLDLFSGTGNLGIEALSRGAESCVFCDSSRESIRLTRMNIEHCRAEEKSKVVFGDYRKVMTGLAGSFGIIILDPPYGKGCLEDCFKYIDEYGLLEDGGVIVAEHRRDEQLPENFFGFEKVKERKYGIIMLSIYEKA